jgi:hypothetical protein
LLRFTDYGLLEPGDFPMTIQELRQSLLVEGELWIHDWDRGWRRELVDNLEILVMDLWDVGIEHIFIDGSFVTCKGRPNDVDGFFLVKNKEQLEEIYYQLNQLNPVWEWHHSFRTWDHRTNKNQLPMWHTHHVELFPSCKGIYAGKNDPLGQPIPFPDYFRIDKDSLLPKGIVKIEKG